MKLKVTNESAINIDGIALSGMYRDSVGDEHNFLQGFTLEKIKAGGSRNGSFSTDVLSGTSYKNAKVWIRKVLFADGTKWEDDGTHACNADPVPRLGGR